MSHPSLAIATRLHLGHASHPPPSHQLSSTLSNFAKLAHDVNANVAIVAVDAEERIEGYDLVAEVEKICREIIANGSVEVLPVQPWGKFVPALNAIIAHSARKNVECLLLASAEVSVRGHVMKQMWSEMCLDDTLVIGAALQGHQYTAKTEVELSGRTCPWNTFALWNLHKLALTGFLQVSEGLHGDESIAGIEEVCTVGTMQRIHPGKAKAKLIKVDSPNEVLWGQDFEEDEARREWHERKMMSKDSRAKKQLNLMGLSGTVWHC